jgi:AraC-like DNA-binding protein
MANIHPASDRLTLEYLYGGTVVYQPGERLAPRRLTDYEFVLMIEGRAEYRANGVSYALEPGSIVLAQPGTHEEYRWDTRHRTRHAYFHFGIKTLPPDWPLPAEWPVVRTDDEEILAGLFRSLRNRVSRHSDWPAETPSSSDCRIVEALMELFLRDTHATEARFERERPEPVRLALKWMREVIDEDPGRSVRLSDLAGVAHVTPKHLCRVFRRAVGHPPMETYRLLRLQLSLALLARSNLSIKEVAERCGFDDALYFSRCFSRAFGSSPRLARNAMRSGRPPPPTPLPPDLMPRMYW